MASSYDEQLVISYFPAVPQILGPLDHSNINVLRADLITPDDSPVVDLIPVGGSGFQYGNFSGRGRTPGGLAPRIFQGLPGSSGVRPTGRFITPNHISPSPVQPRMMPKGTSPYMPPVYQGIPSSTDDASTVPSQNWGGGEGEGVQYRGNRGYFLEQPGSAFGRFSNSTNNNSGAETEFNWPVIAEHFRQNAGKDYTPDQVKKIQARVGAPQTGIYDATTAERVADWQQVFKDINRLSQVDGEAGRETYQKMFGVDPSAERKLPINPAPVRTRPPVEQSPPNLDWDAIAQHFRANAGKDYTQEQIKQIQSKVEVEPTGTYGPTTAKNVYIWQERFQEVSGLRPDGEAGENTYEAMFGSTPLEDRAPSLSEQFAAEQKQQEQQTKAEWQQEFQQVMTRLPGIYPDPAERLRVLEVVTRQYEKIWSNETLDPTHPQPQEIGGWNHILRNVEPLVSFPPNQQTAILEEAARQNQVYSQPAPLNGQNGNLTSVLADISLGRVKLPPPEPEPPPQNPGNPAWPGLSDKSLKSLIDPNQQTQEGGIKSPLDGGIGYDPSIPGQKFDPTRQTSKSIDPGNQAQPNPAIVARENQSPQDGSESESQSSDSASDNVSEQSQESEFIGEDITKLSASDLAKLKQDYKVFPRNSVTIISRRDPNNPKAPQLHVDNNNIIQAGSRDKSTRALSSSYRMERNLKDAYGVDNLPEGFNKHHRAPLNTLNPNQDNAPELFIEAVNRKPTIVDEATNLTLMPNSEAAFDNNSELVQTIDSHGDGALVRLRHNSSHSLWDEHVKKRFQDELEKVEDQHPDTPLSELSDEIIFDAVYRVFEQLGQDLEDAQTQYEETGTLPRYFQPKPFKDNPERKVPTLSQDESPSPTVVAQEQTLKNTNATSKSEIIEAIASMNPEGVLGLQAAVHTQLVKNKPGGIWSMETLKHSVDRYTESKMEVAKLSDQVKHYEQALHYAKHKPFWHLNRKAARQKAQENLQRAEYNLSYYRDRTHSMVESTYLEYRAAAIKIIKWDRSEETKHARLLEDCLKNPKLKAKIDSTSTINNAFEIWKQCETPGCLDLALKEAYQQQYLSKNIVTDEVLMTMHHDLEQTLSQDQQQLDIDMTPLET